MSDVRVIARERRDRLGEGPLWSARDDSLFWVDILGRRINRMALADGRVECFEQPHYAAWIIEREAGGLVAGIGRDIVRIDLDTDMREAIVSVDPRNAGNRLNDAKADAMGRIWAGTMPVTCDWPSGAFYRLDPDGTLTQVDGPYTIANGPAIDPDGVSCCTPTPRAGRSFASIFTTTDRSAMRRLSSCSRKHGAIPTG